MGRRYISSSVSSKTVFEWRGNKTVGLSPNNAGQPERKTNVPLPTEEHPEKKKKKNQQQNGERGAAI
jgi:hypothetical protein